jgi:hypothetical protein
MGQGGYLTLRDPPPGRGTCLSTTYPLEGVPHGKGGTPPGWEQFLVRCVMPPSPQPSHETGAMACLRHPLSLPGFFDTYPSVRHWMIERTRIPARQIPKKKKKIFFVLSGTARYPEQGSILTQSGAKLRVSSGDRCRSHGTRQGR